MEQAILWYFDLLAWIIEHPFLSIGVLLAEFFVMYRIYYSLDEPSWMRYTVAPFFSPQNAVFNIFCMTLIGLDPPREFTTTERLKRWNNGDAFDVPIIGDAVWWWRRLLYRIISTIGNQADPEHF